jgi:Ca2+-binding RTX toxin-like protein
MEGVMRQVGAEFGVNTVTQGRQGDQAITRLADGRFVVVWTDSSQAGTDWDESGIKAQIFDADGTKIGGEFLVNAFVRGAQTGPTVAALFDGNFVITWTTSWQDPAGGGDGSGSAIKGRTFGPDGTPLGDEFLINHGTALDQNQAWVYESSAAAFSVTWQSYTSIGEVEVSTRRFDLNGEPIDDEVDITGTLAGSQVEPVGVRLYPGRDLIVWTDANSTGGDIKAIFISSQGGGSTGRPLGGEFLVNSVVGGVQGQPDAAALLNGGFVVTWASLEGNVIRAKAQVFAGDGSKIGQEILLSESSHSINSPTVVELETGGFFIAWVDRDPSASAGAIVLGQYFSAGGEKLGPPVLLNDAAVDPAGTIDVAALGQETIVAAWTNAAGDVSGQFASPLAGDDVLFGGPGDDRISGGPGNDILHGNGGDDILHGNGGDDSLDGDAGDDDLLGDEGNDVLRGGEGVDSFDGGSETSGRSGDGGYGDRVSFFEAKASQGVVGDLRTGIISNDGFGNVETMVSIESLGADTAYVDTLYGNDSTNWLHGGLGDYLYGFDGSDVLQVHAATAVVDGGDGSDTLQVVAYFVGYRPDSDGDGIAEDEPSYTSGYAVDLTAGTLRDGHGDAGTVTGIENIVGSGYDDDLRGNGGDNDIVGGGESDVIRLHDGGVDRAWGEEGNDLFFLLGALAADDVLDGGFGVDTIVLQGNYGGGLTLTGNVRNFERLSLLTGGNTAFGEPGTNRYDYVITTHDSNFADEVQARINGAALLAGEDFTFNGSAETDASFVVYGGRGKDTFTGGLGNDIFLFVEERFAAGDTVNGGGGYDGMFLRGNYAIDFNASGYTGLFTGIENLTLCSATDERYARGGTAFDYNITLSNALVKAGETLTVSGTILTAAETMILDGSKESDGVLRLFGGKASDTLKGGGQADLIHGNLGADTLAGGGGADIFRYDSTAESNSASRDRILDFTPGTDRIDLSRIDARTNLAGDQAFIWIGSNAFSGNTAQLRAFQQGGEWIVQGDVNGDRVADFVVALTLQGPTPLGAGDFIL